MEFWKMNGAGNDFIIINNFKGNILPEKMPYIAETLCERHLSIGADGFMVVTQPSEEYKDKADFRMLFFNSDGSLGEMCGNGASADTDMRPDFRETYRESRRRQGWSRERGSVNAPTA